MSKALSFDPPPTSADSFEDNEITYNIRKFDYFPGLNTSSATRRGSSATSLLSKGVGSVLNSLQSGNNKTKGGGLRVIHQIVIANNYMTIATNDCCIIRLCIENVNDMNYQDIQLIETRRPDDTINNIYVDYTGQHRIISLKNGDNYYLNYKSTRPKKLTRLNGMIQSVAFDPKCTVDTITKSFLVGTSQGFIYELSLESGGAEKSCTLVYQLDIQIPITSLYFEFLSNSNDANGADNDTGDNKIFVMCATSNPTRLYSFVGGPTFTSLFADHISAGTSAFTELGSDIKKPELLVYASRGQKLFALLTKMGIYHGVICLHGSKVSSDTVLTEAQLMPYNLIGGNQSGNTTTVSNTPTLSLIATDFHFLLITNDHLQVISKLNGAVEQESVLTKPMSGILIDGAPIGTVRDAIHSQSLWFFTESSIYQFIGNNETRNVWKIYLEKAINGEDKHFDTAMEFCQRVQDREQVVRARAEFYIAVNKFEQAARIYVQANLPFDEVVLRLLRVTSANISDRNAIINKLITSQMLAPPVSLAQMGLKECPELHALRIYLQEKLNLLPSSSKSQRTMIATWICEIFIHHITASTLCISSPTADNMISMFKDFLRGNRNILDHSTVFSLLNSRGMAKHRLLSLFYAQIVGNYDLVLNQYMNEHRFADALVVLSDAPYEKVEQVISKISPILIEFEPEAATNMFFKHFPRLQPSVVLSALMRYSALLDEAAKDPDPSKASILEEDAEGNKCNFAIKYLKNCIDKADNGGYACDSSIYHTLIWFLCKYDNANEDELIEFLQPYVDRVDGKSCSMMDLNHVLRQCNRYKRAKSVILTLMLLEMTEDAVQLAIKVDLNFAKELASKSYLNDQRKTLWIMIFKHIIAVNSSSNSRNLPKQLLGLIDESNGVLRIEDLLPHLPDFTEIDTFKDEICNTLEEYGSKIERLKDEMKELSDSAENTVKELEKMKKRGLGVAASQRCEYCTETLFSKIFYLFPCSHGFHSECILRNIHMTCRNDSELHDIKALEESIRKASISAKDPSDKRATTQYEYLLAELDGLIAADCPLCGYAMIRSLSVPLINTDEEIECMKSWAL